MSYFPLTVFVKLYIVQEGTAGRSGMYCEWTSLSTAVQNCGEFGQSVLNKFPAGSGKEVVLSVIKQFSSNLGIAHPPEPSKLAKDSEVTWCMEVSKLKIIIEDISLNYQ